MPRLLRIPEAASLGIHAAVAIAADPDRPTSVRELAERLGASEAHLAKVMQRLVKARIVNSTRGPKGGFRLERAADGISLLDIYEAIEGVVEPATCLFGTPACGRETCVFGGYLEEFDSRFRSYLANTKLSDLDQQGELVQQQEATDGRPQTDHQD